MAERFTCPVAASVLLYRDGRLLMLRRAGNVYQTGKYGLPSGHLEEGETIIEAAVRETREETGIALDPATLGLRLAMHHHSANGLDHIGFFFEPEQWDGEPVIGEPCRCSGLLWADPASLPGEVSEYCLAGLTAIRGGKSLVVAGWDR